MDALVLLRWVVAAPISLFVVFCGVPASSWSAGQDSSKLEVSRDPSGGVRATATLVIPAPPDIVQAILTDYVRWPELFDVKMRLAHLDQREGRAVTDLYIQHAFLPGERRLLCESEVLPGGGLVTRLLGGDFKRYQRTWKLNPDNDGQRTHADFDLLVEVDTLAPDWLVAFTLKRELQSHFSRLTVKASETTKPKK
jgi:hypothetical protein